MSNENGQVVVTVNTGRTGAEILEGIERIEALRTVKAFKLTVKRVKLNEIDPRLKANNRNTVGGELFGTTASADTYDVPGMVDDIVGRDGTTGPGDVLIPVDVFVLPNGKYGIFRGRRRFLGASWIATNLADTAVGKLLQTIPVCIHEGMDETQADLLNNDQQSKEYLKSEVYKDFSMNLRAGADCQRLADLNKIALTNAGFGHLRLSELGNLSVEDRRKKMTNWFNGTVKGVLYDSCMNGDRIYNLYGQQLAYNDKIIAIRPMCDLTKSTEKSKRISEAKNSVKADRDAGEYDYSIGSGPRLEALLTVWSEQDATPTVPGAGRTGRKLKPSRDIQTIVDGNKAGGKTLASAILSVAFEDVYGDPHAFGLINNYDKAYQSYRAYRENLPRNLTMVLDTVFSATGADRFDEMLASNIDIAPVIETPALESVDATV